MKSSSLIVSGRWRPVQGSIQALSVFTGARGLIYGPQSNEAIAILSPGITSVELVFYASLFFGGLIAMLGEVIQLRQPMVALSSVQLGKLLNGLQIESAAAFMLAINYLGYVTAIFMTPDVDYTRAYTALFFGLGMLGRSFQCLVDFRRIRKGLRSKL